MFHRFPMKALLLAAALAGAGSVAAGTIERMQVNGVEVEYYLPTPLPIQISADGLTKSGGLPVVTVADPNPPKGQTYVAAPARDVAAATSTSFVIDYVANGGSDLWSEPCYTFPDEAKAAFNAAADIWAGILNTTVPIRIRACWATMGGSSTLGYSGGGNVWRDFSGALQAGTYYNESLANALHGSDLGSGYDMHITYNSAFSWYYGLDGNTPSGQYDLLSVVLHEIAHGLNFSGSAYVQSGNGYWGYGGYPDIYDRYMRDGAGTELLNTASYPNPSTQLAGLLTSTSLWFHGANAMAANGGQRVKMYAPGTWSGGSSYSHLDYSTFAGTANRLMVYAISDGVATHDPGVVTKGLLKDLGWPMAGASTDRLLTVSQAGAGSGTVTSSPAGINCGVDCSQTYANGTSVTLTAAPAAGSTFTGWSGECAGTGTCVLAMTANRSATANFGVVDDNFPPAGGLPGTWTQPAGSSAVWTTTTETAYGGSSSMRSGVITHSQNSALAYTGTFTSGTVSFARRVSSEGNFDYLRFYIDDVQQGAWSGDVAWDVVSYPISAGTHTLKWVYSKDSSISTGSDAAWIDSVSLPVPAPVLQMATTVRTVAEGAGRVVLTVNRGTSSAGSVSVNYSTAPGTALAGSDYTTTSGTLTWANGDMAAKTITVPIVKNTVREDPEQFTVSLSNPTGGAVLGTATTTVTIVDNPGLEAILMLLLDDD